MQSNSYNTLGGEGWPGADVAECAEKRNILGLLPDHPLQDRAALSRTQQEQAGPSDTPLAQPAGFVFTRRSVSDGWSFTKLVRAFNRYLDDECPDLPPHAVQLGGLLRCHLYSLQSASTFRVPRMRAAAVKALDEFAAERAARLKQVNFDMNENKGLCPNGLAGNGRVRP